MMNGSSRYVNYTAKFLSPVLACFYKKDTVEEVHEAVRGHFCQNILVLLSCQPAFDLDIDQQMRTIPKYSYLARYVRYASRLLIVKFSLAITWTMNRTHHATPICLLTYEARYMCVCVVYPIMVENALDKNTSYDVSSSNKSVVDTVIGDRVYVCNHSSAGRN